MDAEVIAGLCFIMLAALVAIEQWIRFLDRRDVRRHAQRTQLLELRAAAWKADELDALKQRLQRVELRQGMSR